ncbi:MAG: hypothetical protein JWP11_3673 [Frankiales bacterium]|nr:hypothetical protein [Frankiales bacterium]
MGGVIDQVAKQLRRAVSRPDPSLPPRRMRRAEQVAAAKAARAARRQTFRG